MRRLRFLACAAALAVLASATADAARAKKPRASRAVAARPIYGPPAPPPEPQLRAAGSCVSYEPGRFILVAEVGQHGRMFRIDAETVLKLEPRRGTRVRLIYVDTPDGPIAREVLPGPVETDKE